MKIRFNQINTLAGRVQTTKTKIPLAQALVFERLLAGFTSIETPSQATPLLRSAADLL
ncbi:hypothetical protein [Rhizobium rhizogenes]|uniref:hypothetical protein n=1 Tax=Rhizobium rhizogenes TaxID=359 RepID=UPI0015740962|nr:hypothetical protein [Rhizobium rhizogenes]NTF69597.1 hypothetical protein [Rhizobium rhizogenes]